MYKFVFFSDTKKVEGIFVVTGKYEAFGDIKKFEAFVSW